MGKFVSFLSILIFIDLLFVITGQLTLTSPTSIIINAILDPSSIQGSQLWLTLFGVLGIGGLAVLSGVSTGIVSRAGVDILGFTVIAVTLVLLVGDYIAIFLVLKNLNVILATLVMSPVIAMFVLVVAEWLRGKD